MVYEDLRNLIDRSFLVGRCQGFCDPLCQSGYHPNVTLIPCFAGKLQTLWECLGDPCPAPSLIQYGAPVTCKEGPEIPHQGSCTPSCSDGYESTETWLKNHRLSFSSERFYAVVFSLSFCWRIRSSIWIWPKTLRVGLVKGQRVWKAQLYSLFSPCWDFDRCGFAH